MRYPKLTRFGLSLAVLIPLARSAERQARADEIDDYTRKLIELDQRVHVMSLEFKETPAPPADVADRRVLDAQVLFSLKNYEEAATVLLDVIEKYPNSRAYDDALFLLGESLFQGARPLFVAALLRAVPAAQHRLGQGAGRAPAADRDLVPHRRLRARRRVPGQAAEHPARAARAGDAVRARQAVLLPRQGRRGAGRLLRAADQQPVLLPGALLHRDHHGEEGRSGRRVGDLRFAPAPAGAGRFRRGDPGPVAPGARAHPLRALAVRQGDRHVPVDPAPVEVLRRGARRAGLDVHQGQGMAKGLAVDRPPAAQQPRHARRARQAAPAGQSSTAHRELLPGARRVLEGARRVRADPAPAQGGDRPRADRPGLLRQPGRPQPGEVRHLGLRAAGRLEVGQGRARRRAHDQPGVATSAICSAICSRARSWSSESSAPCRATAAPGSSPTWRRRARSRSRSRTS